MEKNRRTLLNSCPQMALAVATFEHLMGAIWKLGMELLDFTTVLKGRWRGAEVGGFFSRVTRDRICLKAQDLCR